MAFRNKKHPNRARSHAPKFRHKPKNQEPSGSQNKTVVEGVLQHKGKFGFVLSEDPNVGDVMIQGHSLALAMPNDRVRARVKSVAPDGRRSGDIISVLERANKTFVGTFKRMGNMAVVASDDNDTYVRILDMKNFSPKVGEMAVVEITKWPETHKVAGGTLKEILGSRDTPGVDLQTVIRKHGLPQDFPEDAAHEADSFGEDVPETAWMGTSREVMFNHRVFTIDGEDAKDFDDAVSIEPLPNGWRLGVHIADVAQYVQEGKPLDVEAEHRGTSVYMAGTVIPMLPFPLSDGLCSLRPDTVRLTLSCIMDIDRGGHVGKYRIVESVIRSSKRFTYNEVEKILKGENPSDLDSHIIEDVRTMGALARLIRKNRFSRGSLDFDFPEEHIVNDLDGRPIDIKERERLEAHRLIEDFMVLANETVATHMSSHPFLYRIHEMPDPARIEKLSKSLEILGVPLARHKELTKPAALAAVLSTTEGKPIQPLVHLMVLRSLKQAVYSPTNKGHFGLASKCYTHFTSPIRRYPDLIVHRILKEYLHNMHRKKHWSENLTRLCEHASQRERLAVDAEREFIAVQKVRLMQSHVGETFMGTITSVTNFGFFVQLDQFFVDGLVHVTNLGNDYFIFNEHRMMLTGRRSGQQYAVGQKVKVLLAAANILKRQLDFELVQERKKRF